MFKIMILGAGMTGLSAAYHLKHKYFLAEKMDKVGGHAGSIEKNGYIFDYAEHFLRIPNEYIETLFKKLMSDNIFSQQLISSIYFKKKFVPYPFQANLRELPLEELKKCAKSLILNHFLKDEKQEEFENFEEYIYYLYGDYIANEFMIPYNEKIWSITPRDMSTSWFINSNFIPSFNLDQILDSILPLSNTIPQKHNLKWYPIKGGSQAFGNSFLPHISHLALNHEAVQVDIEKKITSFQNKHSEPYDKLISTIPLPELLKIIVPLPSYIKNLISKLKYNSVYCMNLCLDQKSDHPYHWLYFPDKNIPFSRLFFSSNFSKYNVPAGKGSCSALKTYLPDSNFDAKLFEEKSIQSLIELGFLKDDSNIVKKIPLNLKYGFTLPTIGLSDLINTINNFLTSHDIYSVGRYGEWKYSGIEHAIDDGKNISIKLSKR